MRLRFRGLCRRTIKTMGCFTSIFREEKNCIIFVAVTILLYYVCMDLVLYHTLQHTSLPDEGAIPIPKLHSPFHPLSIKLITLDHNSHYFMKPTAEIFNYVTGFSDVFFFITPNMISATHALIGIVVGVFVASDSLRYRRIGALLYEFRSWLDSLDGVVYRHRKGQTTYTTQGNLIGSQIDNYCDVIGGVALCLGTLYYLVKKFATSGDELPSTKNGTSVQAFVWSNSVPSKKVLALKIALYGALVGIAGNNWEKFVTNAENVFEKKLTHPQMTALQTSLLHSCTTWSVLWSWKLVGQQTLHYLVVAILIDRVWELINFGLYVGYPVIITLILSSCYYIKYVQSVLFQMEAMYGMENLLSKSTLSSIH